MKFLILNREYNEHVDYMYSQGVGLEKQPFETQLQESFLKTGFLFAGVYSKNLISMGHEAFDFPTNNKYLLLQWASENGLNFNPPSPWKYNMELLCKFISYKINLNKIYLDSWYRFQYNVVLQIVKKYKPDIIYVHEDNIFFDDFIGSMKKYCNIIAAQVDCKIPSFKKLNNYDIIFSSGKLICKKYRDEGRKVKFLPLGFDHYILNKLPTVINQKQEILFAGAISHKTHFNRVRLLEELIKKDIPLKIMGFVADGYKGPLLPHIQKQAWGLDLYRERKQYAISLHIHAQTPLLGSLASNAAMYEITGSSALLFLENLTDVNEYFTPESEIITFKNVDDCVLKLKYFLNHPEETGKIATRGHQRTLKEHTYFHRTQILMETFKKMI